MYRDEIDNFLRSKMVRAVRIPDCEQIKNLDKLDIKKRERAYMLLSYISTSQRFEITKQRERCGITFNAYEIPIFSSVKTELLGNTYSKEILTAFQDAGIITKVKTFKYHVGAEKRYPSIYTINRNIFSAPSKTIFLTTKSAISAWTRWLYLRVKPFNVIDRVIIIKHHKRLSFAIDGVTYAKQYRRQARLDAISSAKQDGKIFNESEWRKGFIYQCRNIDSFNSIADKEKWMLCRVDPFGKRLHHALTCVPSTLRKYSRVGDLVPLFECDLTASQPTITAALMPEGTDNAYIDAINSGLVYERYADSRGLGWTRGKAKEMFFAALFGSDKSPELKNLQVSYPGLASWLKSQKQEIRETEANTLTDYKPSKNNCIDAQRAESKWARSVWGCLDDMGIVFLPIHDSVIVFGRKGLTQEDKQDRAEEVTRVMQNLFRDTLETTVKATIHVTMY